MDATCIRSTVPGAFPPISASRLKRLIHFTITEIDEYLKGALYIAPDYMDIHYDESNKYYALTGFKKMHVDLVYRSLKEMSGDVIGPFAVFSQFGLRGMKIEYVEGVFKIFLKTLSIFPLAHLLLDDARRTGKFYRLRRK
jgi:hypothetical protein